MNSNPLKILIIYVSVLIRHYWKIFMNVVLEYINFIEIFDLQTGKKYFNLMKQIPLISYDRCTSGFYVMTVYIDRIKYRILLYCTPQELATHIKRFSDRSDRKKVIDLDLTLFSDILDVKVTIDENNLNLNVRGWNSNLCVLKSKSKILKTITTEEWIRAAIIYHLYPESKFNLDMNDQKIKIIWSSLDSMIEIDDIVSL